MFVTATASTELLQEFYAALRARLAGELRTDAMARALYSTDASMYAMQPLGVVIPRYAEDLQVALEEAARFGLPVLPRGGGSSLAGQTVGEALVLDCTRYLDEILELNVEERWVRVQPGLVLDRLNAALQPHGLMVGPDPASSSRATLGGMMANNSTGTHSILYGNFIDHIRRARCYLADGSDVTFSPLGERAWEEARWRPGEEGRIYRELHELLEAKSDIIKRDTPQHWRRNSGYRLETLLEKEKNLARLLCGSEGTLAVLQEIELNLVPRPKQTALAVVHFQTLRAALEAVTTILESEPSAVELIDGVAIQQGRKAPGFRERLTFIEGDPGAVLFTEFYGTSAADLRDKLDKLEILLRRARQGYRTIRMLDPMMIRNVWSVRTETLGLVMGVKGDHKPVAFVEDAAVPVEHLAEYIEAFLARLDETQTRYAVYAHASAGCLHLRPFINTKDAADVEKMRELAAASMSLVRKFGGAVSSEHGDGLARSWLNESLLGSGLYRACQQAKAIFDPDNRLNPGKVVEAPPMTENLRMGPTYETIPLIENLDFSAEESFTAAVEMCNGNGACRKLESGTMCPSFMVLRDEAHSTRGRANALRSAFSGAAGPDAWTGQALYEVMDLCVECKGCKTECPSNVDMTKLKTEWLSHYWDANRMPLRTRLFAHLPRLSRRLHGPLARVANWFNSRAAVGWLLDRTLGISSQRVLPPFAVEPFDLWFKKQVWSQDGPPVVLFADTFNGFHHTEITKAAAIFLDKAGYQVKLAAGRPCCGRPLISKGLVTEAQLQALATVDHLHPYAADEVPIIGLEPSCILTLRDEFLALLPGEPRARAVAKQALTFEEFIAQERAQGNLDHLTFRREARAVLVHGHCHQKALSGTAPSYDCLTLPPNYEVTVLDTSCCGMAGAFGYEKEHYELSMAMAERRLATAVRDAAPDTLIAAAGTSCRAQIQDATGRTARHPAQILLDALV